MRYLRCLLLIIVCFSTFIQAEFVPPKKIVEIVEPFQYPVLAAVDNDKIYIYDAKAVVIHIYSRKDFHLLGKFGGFGEGPAEFKFIHHLLIYPGYIFISSGGKISYFSLTGELKKEIKTPYAFSYFFPLAENFVCQTFSGPFEKQTISIKILDEQLTENKEIDSFQSDFYPATANGKMNFTVVRDFFGYKVDNNRIFVGNTKKGFHFTVYDSNGNKEYQVNRTYQKQRITGKDKEEDMESLLKEVGKARFEQARKKYNYLYPEFFPAYSAFTISKDKIYILTYPRKNEQQEMIVLDTKGNFLKQTSLYTRFGSNDFCIFDGTYYYLRANEENDNWELYAIKIFD